MHIIPVAVSARLTPRARAMLLMLLLLRSLVPPGSAGLDSKVAYGDVLDATWSLEQVDVAMVLSFLRDLMLTE